MKIHNFDQRSDEWKSIRMGKFGGTDAQIVANNGTGLQTLIYKKVAELMTGKSEDEYTNLDMQRGVEQEEIARGMYELTTGREVKTVGYCENDEYSGCSPDGLVGDDGLVEIKCQKDSVFVKTMYTKKIDTKYVYQIQMQLYVTGREWCDFVAFNDNFKDLIIITVKRDEAIINKIKLGLEEGKKQIKQIMERVKNENN